MSNISELVKKAKERLDRTSNSAGLVGNRMHYPMIVNYYGTRVEAILESIKASFDRIWPQTSENIVYICSSLKDSGSVGFKQTNVNSSKFFEKEEIQTMIDDVRLKRGIFASMLKWCLYNIIDTAEVQDMQEFEIVYRSISDMSTIVDGPVSTMLILLLDESSTRKEISSSIREFLSEKSDAGLYNGTIVISNKTIRNELYKFEELFEIVAGTIILSNNDSVSIYDDDDYKKRVSCLFGGRTLTMAYSSLKRPNQRICLQILNEFLNEVYDADVNCCKAISETELAKRLGIENGRITFIEDSIRHFDVKFPSDMFAALPLKKLPDLDMDINVAPFNVFYSYVYDGVFDAFLEQYCKNLVEKSSGLKDILNTYSIQIRDKIISSEIANLPESFVDNIINALQAQVQRPNTNLSLSEYFKNYVKYYIKKYIVYPQVRQVLLTLKDKANTTLAKFSEFRKEYVRFLPIDGFDELGTIYSNLAENYFHTTAGEQLLKRIILPGNGNEEFTNALLKAFNTLIEQNEDIFSLTFIEEWERRLNLAGDEVYRRIQSTFERDFEQKLFLFGNYQRNVIPVEVYMCHTADASGQNQTELYKHLKNAIGKSERTQFVNTGMDDTVEAFRFIDCTGNNILL